MSSSYLKHAEMTPRIAEDVYIAPGAVIVGDAVIDNNASVWYNAVIRADNAVCHIGEGSNLQDCAVIHCEEDYPVEIGKNVTIGHGAIVHGARIGDNTLIGMGAVILNGADIGSNCLIGAGALVTGGTVIPDRSVVMGTPGKVKRQITDEEIRDNHDAAMEYIEAGKMYKEGRASVIKG